MSPHSKAENKLFTLTTTLHVTHPLSKNPRWFFSKNLYFSCIFWWKPILSTFFWWTLPVTTCSCRTSTFFKASALFLLPSCHNDPTQGQASVGTDFARTFFSGGFLDFERNAWKPGFSRNPVFVCFSRVSKIWVAIFPERRPLCIFCLQILLKVGPRCHHVQGFRKQSKTHETRATFPTHAKNRQVNPTFAERGSKSSDLRWHPF